MVNIINSKNIHNFQVLLNKKLIFSRGKVARIAIIHTHNHNILKKVQLIWILTINELQIKLLHKLIMQ